MAPPRTYRHDVRCPRCGSNWMRKSGFGQGRQIYRCGDCAKSCIPGGAFVRPGPEIKERALRMYGEGSSLSAIGRVLGYSAQAVSRWVKKGDPGPGAAEPPAPEKGGQKAGTES